MLQVNIPEKAFFICSKKPECRQAAAINKIVLTDNKALDQRQPASISNNRPSNIKSLLKPGIY